MPPTFRQRCRNIEMLLLDVDGVLTDGRIIYTDDETEIKAFHVRDGSALKIWQRQGKKAGVITGRNSSVVARRAKELGLDPVIQAADDKLAAFRSVLETTKLPPEKIAHIGDDLPDLPIFTHCGLAIAVADACPEVQANAHYVTRAAGGRGAVREAVEMLLRGQGLWQTIVEQFRGQPLS